MIKVNDRKSLEGLAKDSVIGVQIGDLKGNVMYAGLSHGKAIVSSLGVAREGDDNQRDLVVVYSLPLDKVKYLEGRVTINLQDVGIRHIYEGIDQVDDVRNAVSLRNRIEEAKINSGLLPYLLPVRFSEAA